MSEKLEKVPTHYMPFRCSKEMADTISRIAQAENRSRSDVIRDLCEKGLVAGGYISGTKQIDAIVRDTLREILQPAVDRLASISAKGVNIGAAAFFLELYTNRQFLDGADQELTDIAAKARRLGVEYLKVSKNQDLDEWLSGAVTKL